MRPVRFPEECGLFVDFGGDDAPEHHQRIGDQRFEFVLARIDRDRSDERAAFADVLHDRLVVGDAAREDDGLNAAREGRGHGSDLFHDVVAHGVENLFGPLVALRDAFHDLNHGVGSQVGHQPAFARNEFQQLLFRILGAVIHVIRMKVSGKQRVLAFGPYLCAGLTIAMLFGTNIINWYISLF